MIFFYYAQLAAAIQIKNDTFWSTSRVHATLAQIVSWCRFNFFFRIYIKINKSTRSIVRNRSSKIETQKKKI